MSSSSTYLNLSNNDENNHNNNLQVHDPEADRSTWSRFSQKFKDQPLVPIGAGATTVALLGAGRALRSGNATQFNLWLRYRVVFQGLTVLAALGGSLYYNHQRDIDRAAQEEERLKRREVRMREQEALPSISRPESVHEPGRDARRALMMKKVADQARLEGRALRMPSNHTDQEGSSGGTSGGDNSNR